MRRIENFWRDFSTIFEEINIFLRKLEENWEILIFFFFSQKNWKDLRRHLSYFLEKRKANTLWNIMNPNWNMNKQTEVLWVILNLIKIKTKNLNQQNVIYVNSTINKINNTCRYMKILVSFILPVVTHNFIEYLLNRSSMKVVTAESIKVTNNFWYITVFLQCLST